MGEDNLNTLNLGRQQTKDPKTWSPLLAGSFFFLDMGPFKNFLLFPPFFGCFGLFMVGRVSSYTTFYSFHSEYYIALIKVLFTLLDSHDPSYSLVKLV
jgi:hypothetical protein